MWRRASARRHINSLRRFRCTLRRHRVFDLWWHQGMRPRDIANHLGVDRSTISRDITAIYLALGAAGPGVSLGAAIRRVPPRRQW